MSIPQYSTLKGSLILGVPFYRNRGYKGAPHYNLIIEASGARYRVAVNTMSQDNSEIAFLFDNYFQHPVVDQLRALSDGAHSNAARLDYWRDKKLVDIRRFTHLPYDAKGGKNDLNDLFADMLTTVVNPASRTTAYISGSGYADDPRDAYPPVSKVTVYATGSAFAMGTPSQGIHDIHMNQGNLGSFKKDNGIHTDGGIIVEVNHSVRAFFSAFQTQRLPTDNCGNPVKNSKSIHDLIGS
jgi:uncharacterized protein YukJ